MEEAAKNVIPRIVLLACGSFSPPTPLHFRMFEIAKDHFEMLGTHKVIGGIISPTHDDYGKNGLVDAKHRCAMIKLCLQSSNWIRLSDWETCQNTWIRTRLVLQYHQNYMNNFIHSSDVDNMNVGDHAPSWLPPGLRDRKDPVQLKLLCGADLLDSFTVPGLWKEEDIENIVANNGLVVISRAGSNAEKIIFESDILTRYQRNITLITNWISNEVSSTIIRRLVGRGLSVKYLIDDLVLEYIKRYDLFNSKSKCIVAEKNEPPTINISNEVSNMEQADQYNSQFHNEMETSSNDISPCDDTCVDLSIEESHLSIVKKIESNHVFCCGDHNDFLKKLITPIQRKNKLNGPGQAVKVITKEWEHIFNSLAKYNEVKIKKVKL